MGRRVVVGRARELISERIFSSGAALGGILFVTALAIHTSSAPQPHAEPFRGSVLDTTIGGCASEGALTLQQSCDLDSTQHLDWQSFPISSELLDAGMPGDIAPPSRRLWRSKEPRISILGDTAQPHPIRFED